MYPKRLVFPLAKLRYHLALHEQPVYEGMHHSSDYRILNLIVDCVVSPEWIQRNLLNSYSNPLSEIRLATLQVQIL